MMLAVSMLALALPAMPGVQERSAAVAPAAPTPVVVDFANHLAAVGRQPVAALPAARAALEARARAATPPDAENLFRVFWRWHEKLALDRGNAFFRRQDLQDALSSIAGAVDRPVWNHPLEVLDSMPASTGSRLRRAAPAAFQELEGYRQAGFDFNSGEGAWYLDTDPRFLAKAAAVLPRGAFKDYVLFWSREADERVVEDAGLVISWEELRLRLTRWERFRSLHATIPEAPVALEREIRDLAAFYLCGVDNTPIFGWDSGALDQKLKTSYERFLSENQSSAYHPAVAAAFDVLRGTRFRRSPAHVHALRRHLRHPDFRPYLDLLERGAQLSPR
jgi:hypothetical protein